MRATPSRTLHLQIIFKSETFRCAAAVCRKKRQKERKKERNGREERFSFGGSFLPAPSFLLVLL
jgi:hypothetical protein|tara:strand:+ start:618 stop:809 length:192 start_codon:yes stop_codon:yes gene_type:complete